MLNVTHTCIHMNLNMSSEYVTAWVIFHHANMPPMSDTLFTVHHLLPDHNEAIIKVSRMVPKLLIYKWVLC